MVSIGIFSTHIQKLVHPIKEIRERGLHQLLNKLKFGFSFDDEVSRTRELFEALISWFQHDKISYQKEVFQLLQKILKSEAGSQIYKEVIENELISSLEAIRNKIDSDALSEYQNVLDLIHFVSNVRSDVDLRLSTLRCSSDSSIGTQQPHSAVGSEPSDSGQSKSSNPSNVNDNLNSLPKHISVYLLPWAPLNDSDMKTLNLMEDTLQVVKSTSRCCRFILHVFMRDFPAEVFLNRPLVVQKLESLLDSVKCGEVLEVLLAITKAIDKRIEQLFDPAFKTSLIKYQEYSTPGSSGRETRQNTSVEVGDSVFEYCDKALDQLPVPFYCLRCACKVFSSLHKMNASDMNTAFDVLDSLVMLLVKCVSPEMWKVRHESKTYRDVVQYTYALLRHCGEAMEKLKRKFDASVKNTHARVSWIRAVRITVRVLTWRSGALDPDELLNIRKGIGVGPLPQPLAEALEGVISDVALSACYPELVGNIMSVVEKPPQALDPVLTRKYRDMTSLCESIEYATTLLNDLNENDPNIFATIHQSLNAFEIHQSPSFIDRVVKLLFEKTAEFDLNDDRWCDVRKICLFLMANDLDWVKQAFYKMAAETVMAVTTSSKSNVMYTENYLNILFDAQILTEICCFGVGALCKVVNLCSKEILVYLLRSKLMVSDSCWRRFIATLLPVMSLLDCHAKRDDILGDAIIRMLDLKIAECMLIPTVDIVRSNCRVTFNKCYAAQMDAAHNLCRIMCMQDDCDSYLPTTDCIRADILISALRGIGTSDVNLDPNLAACLTEQKLALCQIMDTVSKDLKYQYDDGLFDGCVAKESKIDPAFRRTVLQQLAIMLRNQGLHGDFLGNDGLKIVCVYFRLSLTADDYSAYPDCATSCLSILNSLCGSSTHTRHTLARNQLLYFLILRGMLVHPNDLHTCLLGAQLLFMLSQADCAVWNKDQESVCVALPKTICIRTRSPLKINSYWETSVNAVRPCYEWVLDEPHWLSFTRMHWVCSLHNGADKVVKWPCVTPVSMDYAPYLNITEDELIKLKVTTVLEGSQQALYRIQNSTSHKAAEYAIALLTSYTALLEDANIKRNEYFSLQWLETFTFYLNSLPSSPKDVNLVLSVIKFINCYLDALRDDDSNTSKEWLAKSLVDSSDSIFAIVERSQVYSCVGGGDTTFTVKCRAVIARLIARLPSKESANKLVRSLHGLDYTQFNMLVFLNELVRSIRLTLCSSCEVSRDTLVALLESLIACSQSSPQINSRYRGYKGEALLLDIYVCFGAIIHRMDLTDQPVEKCELQWDVFVRALVCGCSCVQVGARAAALSVLARLAVTTHMLYQIEQGFETQGYQCDRFIARVLLDEREASLVKEQAAKLLTVLAEQKYNNLFKILDEANFVDSVISMLSKFSHETKKSRQIESNVPIEVMEEREKHSVLSAKRISHMSTCAGNTGLDPQISRGLVAALADLLLALIDAYKECSELVGTWFDIGLFRLFFRCLHTTECADDDATITLRASVCALLTRVVSVSQHAHSAVIETRDCVSALTSIMAPSEVDDSFLIPDSSYMPHGYALIGALCRTEKGCGVVWKSLKDGHLHGFIRVALSLLDRPRNHDNCDLQRNIFYCFSNMFTNKPKEGCSLINIASLDKIETDAILKGKDWVGDASDVTKYISEEICKVVLARFKDDMAKGHLEILSQDEYWMSAQTCACAVFNMSPQARLYANRTNFAHTVVSAIAAVRNTLTLQGASVETIKNKDKNPSLHTLNHLIILLGSFMRDCLHAKEFVAENNLAISLNKLWPWIMCMEPLRANTIIMLSVFTNKCPKAWLQMHASVGSGCLITEICGLITRDMTHVSRSKSLAATCLKVLTHCLPHAHCRTLILKSEVLDCVEKIHPALTKRRAPWKHLDKAFENFLEEVSKYSDGQLKLWQYHSTLCALIEQNNGMMVRVLANLSYHHLNRAKILTSGEIMDVFSMVLRKEGDEEAKVAVCRAIWALAANNHKAKLSLRASGLASRVRELAARSPHHDSRLGPLVQYTHTLLTVS